VSLWRQIARGVRTLTRGQAAGRDARDEVAHFFDEAAAEFEARGLTPDEARRSARLALGNPAVVGEDLMSAGWEHTLETAIADVRYGLRRLAASPGFTAVAALVLAIGIGAATAIFSVVQRVLVQPLPYPDAGRLAMIWDTARDGARLDLTFGSYREIAARSRAFASLAVMRPWQPTLAGDRPAERLDGQRVSAAYFRTLGVSPWMGRDFDDSDDLPNREAVALVSHRLWMRLGGDATPPGSALVLDGAPVSIIGVMPPGFENVLSPTDDVWAPLAYDPSLPADGREWGHHLRMIGRLRDRITTSVATTELNGIARSPDPRFVRPRHAVLDGGLEITPLQDEVTRAVRPALGAVSAAVLLLVALTSVNLTSLLLTRGRARQRELAMRVALGARRPRLVSQMLVEHLLLAAIGGMAGLAVSGIVLGAMLALVPLELPRSATIGIDGGVFLFALSLTAAIGLAVGILPALQVSGSGFDAYGSTSAQRVTRRHRTLRRTLIAIEVALAAVLLVNAGLLWRTVHHLLSLDSGFDGRGVLVMQVPTSGRAFEDDGAVHRYFDSLLEAVRRVPGVASAAWTSQLPLSGELDAFGVHAETTGAAPTTADERGAFRYAVSPAYFETMGIALRQGRLLDERDTAGQPPVVLVNESFARRRFPGRDPLGQRVRIGAESTPWFTIVGLVGDVTQTSLAVSQADAVYLTTSQWHWADGTRWLVVRARDESVAVAADVRTAIAAVNRQQPVVRSGQMSDLVAQSVAEQRFGQVLLAAFGVMALLIAAVGLYGLLASLVSERTRELGVRSALGASRVAIVGPVVGEGMALTALGLVVGWIGAAAGSRGLASLLFGVSPLDGATYAGVAAVLLVASAVASAIPARRAAQVDPALTLRVE
jgi:putative ABC transport system permease protein